MDDPTAAIVAYRWFQIRDDGHLAGAQNVPWPVDRPLHAEHVAAPFLAPRSDGPAPINSQVWSTLPPLAKAGLIVGTAIVVMAAAHFLGVAAASLIAAATVAVAWQAVRRRRPLTEALLRVSALIIALCALSVLASMLWFIAVAAGSAADRNWLEAATAGAASVVCAALVAGIVVVFGMYYRPPRWLKHDCPAPPRRFIAPWVPECGIYGYRSLQLAADATQGEWLLHRPLVLARISLWGRVFPYSAGFRAEWARIDTLFDDGAGHVEVAACRYGVPVEPLPAGLSAPNPTPPRAASPLFAAGHKLRLWAATRTKDRPTC